MSAAKPKQVSSEVSPTELKETHFLLSMPRGKHSEDKTHLIFHLPFEIYSLDSHWCLRFSHLLKMNRQNYFKTKPIVKTPGAVILRALVATKSNSLELWLPNQNKCVKHPEPSGEILLLSHSSRDSWRRSPPFQKETTGLTAILKVMGNLCQTNCFKSGSHITLYAWVHGWFA